MYLTGIWFYMGKADIPTSKNPLHSGKLIYTQGNPISGYRRLRDFGGKQMTSSSDRVCIYPFFYSLYLIHLIKKLSCSI